MPQPSPSDVHVNAPLTNISVAYIQDAPSVAEQMFPVVGVQKQGDKYFVYDVNDWTRIVANKRGPATESAGGGFDLTTGTYFCDVFAVHKDVDDDTRANADSPISMDSDAAAWVAQQLRMKMDKQWATDFFTTSVWTTDLVGAVDFTKWSSAGSTPIDDIRAQATAIQKLTGKRPNRLCVGQEVDDALKDHADVLDRIKHTTTGVVTNDLLAQMFEVDKYVVGSMMETTSAEDAATQTTDFIYGKAALLAYAAPAPSLLTPSAGYVFAWSGRMGSVDGMRTSRFRMDHLKSDRIEGELAVDMAVIAADCGCFFSAAVA